MHLSLNAVACAMRTKNSGVQDRRARSARYPERANAVCFDLGTAKNPHADRARNSYAACLKAGANRAAHQRRNPRRR